MQSFGAFLFGLALGAVLVYTSLTYHVVNTSKGLVLIPKLTGSFAETYVDVRQFTATDWANHKTLVAAILRAERTDILQDAAAREVQENMQGMMRDMGLLNGG